MAYSPNWRTYTGPTPGLGPIQPEPARALDPGEPRYHSDWRPRPPGAYYDAEIAEAAVQFFPDYCRLTAAEWAGRPFALSSWQADWIIRPAFGWMRADGTRLYRRVIIWIPRKNGKTELISGVSHLCLLGDGVEGAECYSIATSASQAKLVFDAASKMVQYGSELQKHYDVFEDSLYVRATQSKFLPLSGKPTGKHGLKTTYLLGDEVHEWANDRLYTYVRNAMASQREPMEWLISTAGIEDGYGVELWNESIGICEGTFDDPETLVLIWCAPQDSKTELDIQDPMVWSEANPNLGVSVKLDYMQKNSREAAQSTRKENDFKRYHLNIWVGQAERWLPMTSWAACATPPRDPALPRWKELEAELKGRKCHGGLDLASTRDFCSLVWLFEPSDGDPNWRLVIRSWWPEDTFKESAKKSRVPFETWHKQGAFFTTPGKATDHDTIMAQVLTDCSQFQVQGLGIDQFNAHSVATKLLDDGVPVHLARFGMLSMSGPSKWFERLILTGKLDHGGHPLLRWMASNTAIKHDANGNYMPAKDKSAGKIDGIAAAVIASAMSGCPEAQQSYLVSAPLLIL